MSSVAILILAAGASKRMGDIKQLLTYRNTTLLGWSIDQASASKADEVFCVLGANAGHIKNQIGDPVTWIINHKYQDGLSSSIVAGVKLLADHRAVLIMLADQPKIMTEDLNELLSVYDEYPDSIIASNYGESIGVPAVFPKKFFPDLLELKGDKGAKNYLNQHKEQIHLVDSLRLIDIDTQEDYKRLID